MADKAAAMSDSPESSLVPRAFPPIRSDAPIPVRTVHGFMSLPGMVLLWFFPRTMGVRLAASGWAAAWAAHGFALLLGAGLMVWAGHWSWANPAGSAPKVYEYLGESFLSERPALTMTIPEMIKAPFAALAASEHYTTRASSAYRGPTFAVIGLGIEVVGVLLAFAIMPMASAGENGRRLFGRCYRLVLWSSTMFIPLGLGWMLEPIWLRWMETPKAPAPQNWLGGCLFLVWWFIVLWRSVSRYAGPAEGPAWRERTPQCDACGYNIGLLPLTTNCPECGRPVVDSLPSSRKPTAFAAAVGLRASLVTFFSTLRRAMWDRTFFDRLSVHRDPARDRLFLLLVAGLTAVMLGVAVAVSGTALYQSFGEFAIQVAVEVACIGFVVEVLLVGLFCSINGFGARDRQSAIVVVGYAASVSVSMAIVALIGSLGLAGLAVFSESYPLPPGEEHARTAELIGIGCAIVLVLISSFIGIGDLKQALRKTRRANG